jgi:hypothetical protein
LVTSTGSPDVPNAALFTLPTSVGDILYGNSVVAPFTFRGRSTAGIVRTNLRANYLMNGSRAVSGVDDFEVVVYSADSTFNNNVFTNSLSVNTQFNFAGMPFVQYIALDNSNNTIALDVDPRTRFAAFAIIENRGSGNSGAITHTPQGGSAAAVSAGTPIPAGGVHVYQQTGGTGTWSFVFAR